mmetsp:Transcript_71761/g.114225  ORF Transcript_71761/g.114225 Transcript_71761/m.114225 type:complete len:201 (-) Transcript_71761:893-1495(-)
MSQNNHAVCPSQHKLLLPLLFFFSIGIRLDCISLHSHPIALHPSRFTPAIQGNHSGHHSVHNRSKQKQRRMAHIDVHPRHSRHIRFCSSAMINILLMLFNDTYIHSHWICEQRLGEGIDMLSTTRLIENETGKCILWIIVQCAFKLTQRSILIDRRIHYLGIPRMKSLSGACFIHMDLNHWRAKWSRCCCGILGWRYRWS